MAAINLIGARFVDRAQSAIVILLLAVFAVFIAVTFVDIDWDLLAFDGYPPFSDVIASVALTFFAYLGFSVITFAVGDLRDPARELPKAMYARSGDDRDLRPDRARRLRDADRRRGDRLRRDRDRRGRAAGARRRRLHDHGGRRLLATASSVNATLYASGGLTATLAEVGQFPPLFGRGSRLGPPRGLLITAASCSSSPTSSTSRRSPPWAAPARC